MARRQNKRRVRKSAGQAAQALPALSLLTDLPSLKSLQPSERQRVAFARCCERLASEGEAEGKLELGCVVRLDRGYPAIMCPDGAMRAEFAASVSKSDNSRVAVGDWVALRVPEGHEKALIVEVLPRESDIARWRGSKRGEKQTLAANVDLVLVVHVLGETPLLIDRIVRSAVITRDCGAEVAVVLTKADRADNTSLSDSLDAIRDVLGDGPQLVVSAFGASEEERARVESWAHDMGVASGEQGVRGLVECGKVAIMLGESGAGKSTLLNFLMGHELMETSAVRVSDDAGRHTTVTRRMVQLPDGGIIVDAPGLRSLPLIGHEHGLALVFPDVSEQAQACRFRDCTHTHEPDCAVREGLEQKKYNTRRLDAYLSLAAEMRASKTLLDPDIVL